MITCSEECAKYPCCDFCIYAIQSTMIVLGQEMTAGPIGCKLHSDAEHQNIAKSCGYCDDFHCMNVKGDKNENS